jgi:DNA primase
MQTVFDEIKDRLPITDVLASYIALIPSGTQYKAKCPFHSERSASFSVSPDRGLYYCFGCGAKGDIFTFVEQFEGLDKKGALKVLADRAGVQLTRAFVERASTDPLYDVLERATTRYQHELARNTMAREYLIARGLTQTTIDTFRIGYAPDEWRYVANTTTDEAQAVVAERAGLTKNTPKGYYDRFRKRIMFPLTDTSGRVVGFSGRLYPVDAATDSQSPKYLNSPETELFQKSRILFGFDKAKAAIRTHNFAILVEGQMDCVLAHQAGFRNTVATSGTAVSDAAAADPTANLVVLSRLTPNVFLAFDGDAAGQKALDHAAIVALSLGMNPRVVPLPSGVDPADYIKEHGAQGWKALLKQSQHFILHQLRSINKADLSPHVLVKSLKERLFPFLVRIQSPVEQGSYIESIAKELDIPKVDIARELMLFAASKPEVEPAVVDTIARETITLPERFLALSIKYPTSNAVEARKSLEALSFEGEHFTFPVIDADRMSELLVLIERDYGTLDPSERDILVQELAEKLRVVFESTLRRTLSKKLEQAERDGNDDEVRTLMSTLHTLNQRRHGTP